MVDPMPPRKRFGKEMVRFRDEMDHLFNRFFDMDFPISRRLFREGEWAPRVDVSEGKTDIIVKAEIPGCDAADIDVRLDGRRLTISGEKKQEKEEKDENYHRLERNYGSFSRIVELPAEIDPREIDATYIKGVLKLVFRKVRASEAKKIEIKTS
jgi:HSP20 family protein